MHSSGGSRRRRRRQHLRLLRFHVVAAIVVSLSAGGRAHILAGRSGIRPADIAAVGVRLRLWDLDWAVFEVVAVSVSVAVAVVSVVVVDGRSIAMLGRLQQSGTARSALLARIMGKLMINKHHAGHQRR